MAIPLAERDLREILALLDGNQPHYIPDLVAEIRRLRALLAAQGVRDGR